MEKIKSPDFCDFYVGGERHSLPFVPLPDWETGIAVYESFRVYKGQIFRFPQHLIRLYESAKTVGLSMPFSIPVLSKKIFRVVHAYGKINMFLRLMVDGRAWFLWVSERKRPDWIYSEGVTLKTAVIRRSHVNAASPSVKTNAFFNNVLAELEQGIRETFDAILLDEKGYLTEGTIWNVFMIKRGSILTPATGILDGVTRQFVIDCAEKEDLPVHQTYLTRHDFWNADEAFITNTSGGIVPVRSLDERKIGMEVPGPLTKRLTSRFLAELKKELKTYEDQKSDH